MRNLKTKLLGATAVLLTLAILAGATFAWIDYNQHKTNVISGGTTQKYAVRLIDKFTPKANYGLADNPITKEVRVKNVGDSTDNYGDVWVRLQFKEYMEITTIDYGETEHRYMVDENGDFISFASATEATDAGYDASTVFGPFNDAVAGTTGRYYIRTQKDDINGQYGDFIKTKTEETITKITPGMTKASDANLNSTHHEEIVYNGTSGVTPNQECSYRKYLWEAGATNPTAEYIKWNLGESGVPVLLYSEWVVNPVATKAWIIDDRAGQTSPWVYWGAPLEPGETTKNVISTIELKKQPGNEYYYALHVDMQALSWDEIDNGRWQEPDEDPAPPGIIDIIGPPVTTVPLTTTPITTTPITTVPITTVPITTVPVTTVPVTTVPVTTVPVTTVPVTTVPITTVPMTTTNGNPGPLTLKDDALNWKKTPAPSTSTTAPDGTTTIPPFGIIPKSNGSNSRYEMKVTWKVTQEYGFTTPVVGGASNPESHPGLPNDWGYVKIKDLFDSSDYDLTKFTVETTESKYNGHIYTGTDLDGDPAIVMNYLPSKADFKANACDPSDTVIYAAIIPTVVKITYDDGDPGTENPYIYVNLMLAYGGNVGGIGFWNP